MAEVTHAPQVPTAAGTPPTIISGEVAAGATKIIGPFDKGTYNDVHGNLNVTFSKVTTVTLEITEVKL